VTYNLLKVNRVTMHTVPYSEAKGMVCAECAHQSHFEQWTNFVLTVTGCRRKFSMAWNGRRFALNVGLDDLCDRYPALAEEIAEWLQSAPHALLRAR
jgi:hypothetical protein